MATAGQARPHTGPIVSSIPGAPITMACPVPQDLDRFMENPGRSWKPRKQPSQPIRLG